MNHKSVNKSLIFIITATLIGKVLGMARDVLLANNYGTGIYATAFVAASRIPLNFFDFALGAIIGSAFIPVFNRLYKEKGKDYSISFSNDFLSAIILISSLLVLIGLLFTPYIVYLVASGLQGEVFALTVKLTRIMFPMLIFTAIAFTFVGILQSFGEFNIPAMISVVSNLVIIIYFIFFNNTFGVYGLAVAMVLGWFFQMLIQIPFLKRYGFKYHFSFKFTHKELRDVAILLGPIVVSTWVQPINILINTNIASSIGTGNGMVVLEYANKIFIIVAGVFILAITNVIFPSFARFVSKKEFDKFSNLLISSFKMVLFFMLPTTVGIIIHSNSLVKVLYEGGQFTYKDTGLVATALILYSLGIVFYGFREILNRAFYSYGDSKSPMYIAIAGIVVNVIVSLTLKEYIGIFGLPIATSFTTLLMAVSLLINFNYKKHKIISSDIFIYFGKISIITILMGIIVYNMNMYMSEMDSYILELFQHTKVVIFIRVFVSSLVGGLFYLLVARIIGLKIPRMEIDK